MSEILTRFWQFTEGESGKLHEAMEQSLDAITEYFKQPRATKENVRKEEMKIAIPVLNAIVRMRQAESGMVQALAVLGERATKSEEFKEFIEKNLPHISTTKKLKA